MNELSYEDMSIEHKTKEGIVVFKLVKICKKPNFPEENCPLALDWLVAKC